MRKSEEGRQERCAGCGVLLQSDDRSQIGYVPEKVKQRAPVICYRCYRIKHYNEAVSAAVDPNEFLDLLHNVSQNNGLVVHIVDIFDFDGSLIPGIVRFAGHNPIVIVVNKIDLLPKSVKLNKLLNWVRRQLKDAAIKVADIVLCSAKSNIGLDRLIAVLEQHRAGQDIVVVGATNVGKSSLINRLIHDYSELDAELTTSRYPGTTLDVIEIPLTDGKAIIDTPGIVYRTRLTELVSTHDLQSLLPEKPIKPLVFQLNSRQTLFFGAFARFDFQSGSPQSFTCYLSNAIKVHRTKLERADELYEQHKGVMLTPPKLEQLAQLPPLVKHRLQVANGKRMDVVISGLGWIKTNSDSGSSLTVWAPEGVAVLLREPLI